MKRILMIGTGGTIASGKTAEGLMPELTSEQLLSFVPAVSSLCRAECLQLLSLDSTNLAPTHWLLIAKAIRALDFIHSDRSIFKMVDLDEAWTFLQVVTYPLPATNTS